MPSFREQREILALWEQLPGPRAPRARRGPRRADLRRRPRSRTPRRAVLDALEAVGARATFFMLGEQLMRNTVARARGGRPRARDRAPRLRPRPPRGADAQRGARRPGARARSGRGRHGPAAGALPAAVRPLQRALLRGLRGARAAPRLLVRVGRGLGDDSAGRIAELVSRDLADGAIVLLHDSPRYADRPSAEPTAAGASPAGAASARRRAQPRAPRRGAQYAERGFLMESGRRERTRILLSAGTRAQQLDELERAVEGIGDRARRRRATARRGPLRPSRPRAAARAGTVRCRARRLCSTPGSSGWALLMVMGAMCFHVTNRCQPGGIRSNCSLVWLR